MKRRMKSIIALALALCLILQVFAVTTFAEGEGLSSAIVTKLQTEYTTNPIGIDEAAPRLGWQMQSSERGQEQTAYQVMVSSTKEKLAAGDYDMMDTGKVESGISVSIPYEGEALQPSTRYYWQVKVWDKDGNVATSTEEAYFETGLMGTDLSVWSGAKWITPPDPKAPSGASAQYSIESDFIIPVTENDSGWQRAGLGYGYSEDDEASYYHQLEVNVTTGQIASKWERCNRYGGWSAGESKDITEALAAGGVTMEDLINKSFHFKLAFNGANVKVYVNNVLAWDMNLDRTRDINCAAGYYNGRTGQVLYADNYCMKDGEGNVLYFEDFSDPVNTVFGAQFVDVQEDGWARINGMPLLIDTDYAQRSEPAPMFRKDFSADKGAIKSARLYASAAGTYEYYINNQKVGDSYLNPGNSNVNTRMQYQTYDVTGLVKEGGNAIGAYLGHGWYDRAGSANGTGAPWGDYLCLIGKLVITYENGEQDVIVTDSSWSLYQDGPIRNDDIWHGEWYDANKELDGWTEYGFDATGWGQAIETGLSNRDGKNISLAAQVDPAIKNVQTLEPVSVNKLENGTVVYDFGQEITGIVRITVKGNEGDVVTMRHGEWLNEENMRFKDGPVGSVWTRNLLGTQAVDRYILKGGEEAEVFEPSFVYHGFRYMELIGLSDSVEVVKVEGLVLSSDTEMTGSYESSNEMVNKLYSNAKWSQIDNFISVPVDCPQRTERFGWSGDAQIYSRTASYTANVLTFYSDYVQDLLDSQEDDGCVMDMAPFSGWCGYGQNGWGDAIVIIPWNMYQQYGTTEIIEQAYDGMKAWVEWLKNNSDNWIRPHSGYGDHLALDSNAFECVNTAWCARVSDLLSRMAAILGKDDDAAKYQGYFENFRDAWLNKFVLEDGDTYYHSQAPMLMGLAFNLYPEEMRETAAATLVKNIQDNGLKTGFAGVGYLLPTLSDMGYDDVAYALLQNEEHPSWLYSVTKGATTIWEQWNGYLDYGDGTYDIQGSLNHFSFGSVSEWLYSYSAGIQRDEQNPGFKHFLLQPTIGGGMTYVNGSYDSAYGTIVSNWKLTDNGLVYHATVPANTSATLTLPLAGDGKEYFESGVAASKADGITLIGIEGDEAVYELKSGSYEFTVGDAIPENTVAAIDENGETLNAAPVNTAFQVVATTPDDVQKIYLFNEYGLRLSISGLVRTDNGDGTVSWAGALAIGTVGAARTLTLATVDSEGAYTLTDAAFTLAITAPVPEVLSASIPETSKINTPFTLTALTDKSVTKLDVYNEYGIKMAVKDASYEDTDEGRVWTATLSAGTAGTRTFHVYPKNKFGDQGAYATTNAITLTWF